MDAIERILNKHLPERNQGKQHINWGGCGLYALRLSRAIRAAGEHCDVYLVHETCGFACHSRNLRHFIDSYALDGCDLNDAIINHSRRGGSGGTFPIHHICVHYKGKLYDSDGVCRMSIAHHTSITDAALLACVQNGNVWNRAFRRMGQGAAIGKHIILTINHTFTECIKETA